MNGDTAEPVFTTSTLAELPKMNAGEMIGMFIPMGAFFVGIVAILGWVIVATNRTRERERTKRELAAYVAEGSMTPEQAERMIAADMPVWEKGKDWEAHRAAGSAAGAAAHAAASACGNGRVMGIKVDLTNGKVGVSRA
ncbi:MAG: hypothetical protein IT435_11270 [Phycisphaerales bacterium]|nr:hypothetical protein [Phycisphaerales bacterium]